jgi:hypothetical protein
MPQPEAMRPFARFPAPVLASIGYVLADIDDTLTTDGRLEARAYAALERLQAAGLVVVLITGRPAGWCDLITRLWPVDAVVGENGALSMRYDRAARRMHRRFWLTEEERLGARHRLAGLAERIRREVPGAGLASDQAYRECDLAVDISEDVPPLPGAAVERILGIFAEHGATAKLSSIHVNGWFGDWDKLAMTRRLFSEQFAVDLDAIRERAVFVGDSPNDAPMFGYFAHSIGVANVRRFAGRLASPPAYVTTEESGLGFVAVAEALLGARRGA